MSASSAAPGSSPVPRPEIGLRAATPGAPAAAAPRRRLALRTALTLFVLLSVLGTALLIHISWSLTARKNVTDVAGQLNAQIANSISGKLTDIRRNALATEEAVRGHVERIKRHTKLPIGVGFGIRTPEQAAAVARHADAAVVGTGIVDRVKAGLDDTGSATQQLVPGVLSYVKALADGVRSVRKE